MVHDAKARSARCRVQCRTGPLQLQRTATFPQQLEEVGFAWLASGLDENACRFLLAVNGDRDETSLPSCHSDYSRCLQKPGINIRKYGAYRIIVST